MKKLIVTADDFGASLAVNEAVEDAHRHGVLSAASLMVGEPAAADAVARARALPTLGVGLHVVLVEATPVLPPEAVPDLVGADGRFSLDLVKSGFSWYFRPAVRRQLEAEITAQFEAFAATGLLLDHVNAHKHMHLHPTVAGLILRIGRRFGMRCLRLPREEGIAGAGLGHWAMRQWTAVLAGQARRAGIATNDRVLGLAWTGAMDEARVLAALDRLGPGTTEVYSHPALGNAEHAALVSPAVRARVAALGLAPRPFRDA
ncbi:hopanoid biosynthesis-associated protein HpnK [Zavarzinia sp. CC-PAN008]|uniref:hopanoid biosynthesis-associated protein HpnK n=1 Tax=Zavarzinia sp. CC-PAN008 TaxID=3243332 RepID=UPI003F746017